MMCTLFGAAAQLLIKTGANTLPHVTGVVPNLVAMLSSPTLIFGYSLYGVSTVLLVVALKHGELSMLYPIIALTYVWVAIISVVVFRESLTPLRLSGIVVIVVGVAVLGRDKF
jgi:multidrug transporter EmrE-like cation transporter